MSRAHRKVFPQRLHRSHIDAASQACSWANKLSCMSLSRRQFLVQCGAVAVGFSGLRTFLSFSDASGVSSTASTAESLGGYGPLLPDPRKIFDLPAGFSYRVISRGGQEMSDGLLAPGNFDGMCAFAGRNGRTILVRNHELDTGTGAFDKDFSRLQQIDNAKLYESGKNNNPGTGGTSTLIYDTRSGKLEKQYLSLAGTHRNCAGGPTPWGSWITCEETTVRAGDTLAKDHGYNFEVSAAATGLVDPVPLRAMGRFRHEAVAVAAHSGIVYQTEDMGDGLIYRFIPRAPGHLARGGKLQVLKVKGQPGADTRNWSSRAFKEGERYEVEWLDCENVEDHDDDLRLRGFANGAARFARGEGMWAAMHNKNDAIYWACTNGGPNQKGQVWRYFPSRFEGTPQEKDAPGVLELFAEPNDINIVDMADNLTMAPWGDLVLCEDGSDEQFLVGLTPRGEFYKLGRNAYNNSELAGVTFSPDGSTLFVNIYAPGHTLAITGPWKKV